MSDVRTFRAATMSEALDIVRDELGADAVILETRQVARRRLLPWRRPIEEFEVTATRTLEAAYSSGRKPTQKQAAPAPPSAPAKASRQSSPQADRSFARRLDLVSESTETLDELLRRVEPEVERRPRKTGPQRTNAPRAPQPQGDPAISPANRTSRFFNQEPPRTPEPQRGDDRDPTAALARRLDTIQQMLHDLGRIPAAQPQASVPSELFDLYTEMIDAEVEEDLARDLIIKLKQTSPRHLSDPSAARALLAAMVESEIRCCEPIAPKRGRRTVVALVGATGVGKTTTVAKLAANFRLRSDFKMGLVTVDTFRVAAVEQLRTYAEIINLPMKVVTNAAEMRHALDELTGLDLVLIDTAGRSPKDDVQIQELKALLTEARVDEVHLVMSVTSSLKSLEAAAEKFRAAGTTSLILTKLDEISGMGSLLSIARRVRLPISYLTAGQQVPDDIEPAHPRRIARMILGLERVSA